MTQTQKLIEQVRTKMKGATDYKIAQVLDLPTQRLSDFVKGSRDADSYACAKIAEILNRDPLEIIAQVEAEAARTEKKRQYWRSFFSGMRRKAHVFALSATCGFFASGWQAGSVEAGPVTTSHNGGFCSRIGAAGRNIRAWWTTKYGRCLGFSGCFGY